MDEERKNCHVSRKASKRWLMSISSIFSGQFLPVNFFQSISFHQSLSITTLRKGVYRKMVLVEPFWFYKFNCGYKFYMRLICFRTCIVVYLSNFYWHCSEL